MCENHEEDLYQEFPARTIGGPTGDYSLQCDVTSCQWAEYSIPTIANGPNAAAAVTVSGNSKQAAKKMLFDGSDTLNNDTSVKGTVYSLPSGVTISKQSNVYERITHSEKRVFIHIEAGAANSVYVAVRFRIRKLGIVPGPSTTVHPDNEQRMNIARADATRQRLGLDKEIAEGEGHNARR